MEKFDRLRRNADIQRVRSTKGASHSEWMVVFQSAGPGPQPRLGIVASARVGGAVQRNRAKRRIRAAFALEVSERSRDRDFVILAKRAVADAAFMDLRASIRRAIEGPAAREGSRGD